VTIEIERQGEKCPDLHCGEAQHWVQTLLSLT
jgi:hypothetical protein